MSIRRLHIPVGVLVLFFTFDALAGGYLGLEKKFTNTFIGGLRARYSASLLATGASRLQAEQSVDRIVFGSLILFANASESGLSGGLFSMSKEILTEYDDLFRIGFGFFEGEETIYPVKTYEVESIIKMITRNLKDLMNTGKQSQIDMGDLTNYSFAMHAFISLVHWAFAVHSERNLEIGINRVSIIERMTGYIAEIVKGFSPKDHLFPGQRTKPNIQVGDLIADFMAEKVVKGTMPKTKYIVDSTLSALIKLEYLLAREYAAISSREEMELYEDLMISAAHNLFEIKLAWNILSQDEYNIFKDSVREYLKWIKEYLLTKNPYSYSNQEANVKYFRKF